MEKDVEMLGGTEGGQETIAVLMDEDGTNQSKPELTTPQKNSNTADIVTLNLDPHDFVKLTSYEIASPKQEPGVTEPVESENNASKNEKDTEEPGLSQEATDSSTKENYMMEHSSHYKGKENVVDTNAPVCKDLSEVSIDRTTDVVHVEQDPLTTEIRKLDITQCLQMVNPELIDNTSDPVTCNLDIIQKEIMASKNSPSKETSNEQINQEMDNISVSNDINAPETTMQQISKIVDIEEAKETSASNSIVQETSMMQNSDNMAFPQGAINTSSTNLEDAGGGQNIDMMVNQVPDVTMHHDYTGTVSNTQILPCQTEACSVPGVCSICQSILTQTHRPVLIPSEVPANAYPANSAMDRIIHGSINPQLIQGCIVTSTEGRNSEITQYLILQEPEGAPSSYPLTVSPVAVKDRSPSRSSVAAELAPDLEALEGMMEVVVVQQYKCKMCQYKSTSKSTLLRHVKERHIHSVNKDEKTFRKVVRPREEEDEEEDDIIDAGAIDDPNDDSDYSPGEDATRNQQFESAMGALAKERPRRRPGRPRKIPRLQAPEVNTGPPQLSIMNEKVEINVILSEFENKAPSSCSTQEEQKLTCWPRGRPPKHFRGRKYHRYRSRRYYKPPTKPLLRPFICRVCGSRFLTQEDYSFHVNSHDISDPQMFKCQQCSYQCRRWSSLKEHMFNHLGNKPHKCDQCNYTSVYKKDVLRHSAVHQQERKKKCLMIAKNISYPCPVCNRVYTMQKRLTQHLKTHSTEKPHMCDKCGKAFKKRYTFKNHLLTHLHCVEENRYKCEFCEYMCEDRKQLLNHQLTHMNDKPFNCNQCKYHTFRQDFLLTHQATKHAAGKPFACEYCHFTTKHKKNLRLHVKCRHAELYQEWVQRHPEDTTCRRRPFFSPQQIEQLKQQHEQPMAQTPSTQEAENPPTELTYHMLHHPAQDGGQAQNTLEAATIIYEQGGEGDELATQAALDLLLNMSAQRDGPGGALQVAVVKSAQCIDGQEPEASSQEPQMAQVLTLHMDERQVTEVQEAGYGETGMPEAGYDGTVQQITINTAFTTAEYSLINADNMQTPLCSESDVPPKSPHMLMAENVRDKNAVQLLDKSQQLQDSSDQPPPTTKKFSCKICNSAFWGRAEMESHKRAHVEGGSGFKCPDCGSFFAETWDDVRAHMILHSALRPHRCNQCSFASRNKKDLSRHAMTHTNHRPHTCHLCGQRFNRKGHLKFHIERLHTGATVEQPQQAELTSVQGLDEEHIFLAQEETVSNQEDTAYIQEITTADGQTLQQLVTADNQVQYIISQDGLPHLLPQEYVVLPEGHHIQVQDGQITHIQYEPGGQYIQDPQIHFVPMSPTQQLLTQEQLEAAAHSAVTAVADAAMAQTVYTAETESALQQEIQYDVITLAD
ncbi:zinc finger protein 335 isoform 2-T2 [Anomaloglossus baeobatrachus]|uniref:zinc finger protein 335 isoform X2 n=1 Tax=Anomaloglossus baeobatrachus TaxID=238106 RepID=UPI003F5085B2